MITSLLGSENFGSDPELTEEHTHVSTEEGEMIIQLTSDDIVDHSKNSVSCITDSMNDFGHYVVYSVT